MLQERAGENAGKIWKALSEKAEGLTLKQLKKVTKLTEKEMYLGLGWLLREDKLTEVEAKDELIVKLS